ncbi:MAG: homoserine kinase [Chitinophagaceae bacterium]|nr:homoserine kinase [Chitinophagaceae bacterium]MBL0306826.1 homoserine kinase [Chitinophagaceae bacterium]MBP6214931.1 homoserine kinase [Chitinophagaceae bacterium]
MKKVKVHSPGTVANIVCGFDILGLALSEPYDVMEVMLLDRPEVIIHNRDIFNLPTEAEKNVAGVVLLSVMERMNNTIGFEVTVEKHIKPGSGIGSSAASAAGAAVAANYLLGNIFSSDEVVQFAMNGEKLASGVKHADNIAPCILGGISLIRSIHPLDIVSIPAPDLFVTVVHPQIEVRTSDARQILKQQVLLKDAIKQWGNIAGLVTGFMKNDYDLIGRSLEDVIIEPVRSILIPGFDELKVKCKEAGALGGGISGSGPSVFMLSKDESTAKAVGHVMSQVYEQIGIDYNIYVTTINKKGVEVVSSE